MAFFASKWRQWQQIAHRAAQIQSQVVLFVLYFLLVVPGAFVLRAFSRSPRQGWLPLPATPADLESAKNQF